MSFTETLCRHLERLGSITVALLALEYSGAIDWTDLQVMSPFLIGLMITFIGATGEMVYEKIMEWRRWR